MLQATLFILPLILANLPWIVSAQEHEPQQGDLAVAFSDASGTQYSGRAPEEQSERDQIKQLQQKLQSTHSAYQEQLEEVEKLRTRLQEIQQQIEQLMQQNTLRDQKLDKLHSELQP